MAQAVEPLATFLKSFFVSLWLELGRPGWNPVTWSTLTWCLVLFVVLLFIFGVRVAQRRRTHSLVPELLVSKGDIVQLENSILQQLSCTVSNLGDFSVQLLELTLQSSLQQEHIIIEAVDLLRPHKASELTAVLPTDLVGAAGVLKVYAYAARDGLPIYELRANLEWEPWNKRYKVSLAGQTLRPARKLSSARLDELRQRVWLESTLPLHSEPPRAHSHSPTKTTDERRAVSPTKGDLEFPNEF